MDCQIGSSKIGLHAELCIGHGRHTTLLSNLTSAIMRLGAARVAYLADSTHVTSYIPASCRAMGFAEHPEPGGRQPTGFSSDTSPSVNPAQHTLSNGQWDGSSIPDFPQTPPQVQQQSLRGSKFPRPTSGLLAPCTNTQVRHLRTATVYAGQSMGPSAGFACWGCCAPEQRKFASSAGVNPTLKTQLRELYKRVHPDQFQDHPEAQVS